MHALSNLLAPLSFREAVLAFPLAVVLHVAEEWPGFPVWARRFGSPRYSDHAYVATHVLAVALALGTALLVRWHPSPWLVFAFFALAFGPGVLWNAFFHAGACVLSRSYCPGVWTGLGLYLPLALLIGALALRDGLLAPAALGLALAVAAVLHVVEVGHNVFERW